VIKSAGHFKSDWHLLFNKGAVSKVISICHFRENLPTGQAGGNLNV